MSFCFLSLETEERETETRELRELHWNFNNNNINRQQQQQQPQQQPQQQQRSQFVAGEEKTMDEPWLSPDFSQMTRKQQNCEIYRVSSDNLVLWQINNHCSLSNLAFPFLSWAIEI